MKRLLLAFIVLIILGLIALALMPRPVTVRTAEIMRGPIEVTVREEGRTRIRERYVVSAPLAGRLQRITLRPGDPVTAGETVLARIDPGDPALLDARALAEAEARVRRARAALQRSETDVARTRSDMDFAENELARLRNAMDRGAATQREVDLARTDLRAATEYWQAASFETDIARFELELAEAALLRSRPATESDSFDAPMTIGSPIDGRVLRLFEESMAIVQAGTPLMELGDPDDLEVVVDVLSIDAVRILPGARVRFEYWGGPHDLEGRVRLVEPQAFTKVSALGVDEQRVNVIIDLLDPPERRAGLGDEYRVEARIVLFADESVPLVPARALFRTDGKWAVFTIEGGRARVRTIEIGHRTDLVAEIIDGLDDGERVILDPGDRVEEGRRVR